MEIQIMTPSPATSTNATPYTTAPSSPHRFPNFFYSAPTSPIHALVGFHQDTDTDFAFNFTGNPPPQSLSAADELFHAGKIKPLKPPVSNDPHKSPKFNTTNLNPYTESFSQTPCDQDYSTEAFSQTPGNQTQNPPKRGREPTRARNKLSRSSSPFRISDILSDEENTSTNNNNNKIFPNWYSKWNIKNLILFRSVSEGSARRNKDPVKRYSRITTKGDCDEHEEIRKANSCRSGARKVSAHEMHYTVNRAAAEEMRRKTYLPYKSGLFGCLGFNNNGAAGSSSSSVHQISKGINSLMKQR